MIADEYLLSQWALGLALAALAALAFMVVACVVSAVLVALAWVVGRLWPAK